MKFNEYITESRAGTSIDEILNFIYQNCMPYLKELSKARTGAHFLLSGRNDSRDYFIKDVRTDRYPKDMSGVYHEALDNLFNKKFGFKARSNALFVTGRRSTANSYGSNVYAVFPIGNFKFVYSEHIKDLYEELDDTTSHLNNEFDDYLDGLIDSERGGWEETAKSVWEDDYGEGGEGTWIADYRGISIDRWEKSIHDIVESIVEILTNDATISDRDKYKSIKEIENNPKKYIEWQPSMDLEDYTSDFVGDREDELRGNSAIYKEWIDDTIESFLESTVRGYTDKDLNKAIKSENEIMLNCKKYYAINYDIYGATILDYVRKYGAVNPSIQGVINWYMKNNGRLPKQLNLFSDISNDEVKNGVKP